MRRIIWNVPKRWLGCFCCSFLCSVRFVLSSFFFICFSIRKRPGTCLNAGNTQLLLLLLYVVVVVFLRLLSYNHTLFGHSYSSKYIIIIIFAHCVCDMLKFIDLVESQKLSLHIHCVRPLFILQTKRHHKRGNIWNLLSVTI